MKTISIILITILMSFSVSAQDISGQWNGVLKKQGTQLRVVFNVTKTDNGFTIIEFPNLNHLFQESKTGSPNEYAEIEQTFSPAALDEMTKWIQLQTK